MRSITIIIKVDNKTTYQKSHKGKYAENFIKGDILYLPEQAYCELDNDIFTAGECHIRDCDRMFLVSNLGEQDSKIYVCNDLSEYPFEWKETNHIF